jgi:hypothetical protein
VLLWLPLSPPPPFFLKKHMLFIKNKNKTNNCGKFIFSPLPFFFLSLSFVYAVLLFYMIGHTLLPNQSLKSHPSLAKSRTSKIYNSTQLMEQKSNDEKTLLKGVLDKFVGGFSQGKLPMI